MRLRTLATLSCVIVSAAALTACSSFGSKKKEAEAAEKVGRITMVLGDETLEADPSLISELVVLPAPRNLTNWSQSGGSLSKAIGHVAAGADFKVAWQTQAGKGSSKSSALISPPVGDEATIYVIDSKQVITAFSTASGAKQWSRALKSGNRQDKVGIGAGLALAGDKLLVASGLGFVAAFDASNGQELWRRTTEAPMTGAPAVSDGRVFVSSNNNDLIALDIETGAIIWSDQAISESARVLGSPSAAGVEDFIVVPYSSGELIAYLSANGRRLWDEALASAGQFTPISAINDIGARPVLGGGLVFAASQSGVFAAIDGRTGDRVWQQPIGATQAPALAGEYIFILGVEAELACIKASTGQVVWVKSLEKFDNEKKKKGRITYAGPIVASDRIVAVSSSGEALAFDPQSGEQIATLKLGSPAYIEPIAIGDKLFVLTDNGRLTAIR